MKLSAWHKARGELVEWYDPTRHYDLAYQSRVFTDTYSTDFPHLVHADRTIKGGTGYTLTDTLPTQVEHTYPDYALYPQFARSAYGFLTRGCPRNCGFCIVSQKEGFTPYVMIYNRPCAPDMTRKMSRWVNNKRIFYSVPNFQDYQPTRRAVSTHPDNEQILNWRNTDV